MPSQLNGGEYPSPNSVVSNIRAYFNDRTAGPRGQLTIHPAVGQFILDNAESTDNTIGLNSVVEVIKGTQIELHNGYLDVPQSNQEAYGILQNIKETYTIGMLNVPVLGYTYGGCRGKTMHNINKNISVIYGSTVPMRTYTNPYTNTNLYMISRFISISQYYCSLFQAYKYAKEKNKNINIYLSLLGGGVFSNNILDIFYNILCAMTMLSSYDDDVGKYINVKIITWEQKMREEYMVIENEYQNIVKSWC